MRYDGTRATLRGRTRVRGESEITVTDHLTGKTELIPIPHAEGGHGGGDARILQTFADAVRAGSKEALTSARISLESHLLAFAAERSRLSGTIVDMPAYRAEIESTAQAGASTWPAPVTCATVGRSEFPRL